MPDFEFKAREKQVDQMTKDGLVRRNKVIGAVERVSQREQDTAFVERRKRTTIGRNNSKKEPEQSQCRQKPLLRKPLEHREYSRLRFEKQKSYRSESSRSRLRFTAAELAAERLRFAGSEEETYSSSSGSSGFTGSQSHSKKRKHSRLHFTAAELAKEKLIDSLKGSYQIAKQGGKAAVNSTSQGIHKKIREYEDDNSSVKAAHVLEQKSEDFIRKRGRNLPNIKYLSNKFKEGYNSERNGRKDNRKYVKEQRDEQKKGKKKSKSREYQKKRQKRKNIKASREAAQKTEKAVISLYKKIRKKIIEFIISNLGWIGGALLVYLVAMFLMMAVTSCAQGFVTEIATIISSYVAESSDIHDASVLTTKLEAELEKEIEDIPTNPKWDYIDEFHYDIDPIGHDPFSLMAWMTTKFNDFKFADVEPFLRELHNARYNLQYDVEVEVRERTYTDSDGDEHTEEYNYYILNVTLESKAIKEIIEPEILMDDTNELNDRYNVLMETKGGRQSVSNPFDVDWAGSVSSKYGYRLNPLSEDKEIQFHRGIDITMPTGTPIRAGVTGKVIETGFNDDFGIYIVLEDKKGEVQVKYAHCDSLTLGDGSEVKSGETIIGYVGNTGDSTGAHLHIGVKEDGQYVNPIYAVDWETESEDIN